MSGQQPFAPRVQAHFGQLMDQAIAALAPGEALTGSLAAEDSSFVRLNGGRVRQAGGVHQITLALRLVQGGRHGTVNLTLTGDAGIDSGRVQGALTALRGDLDVLPADPHLLLSETAEGIVDLGADALPDASAALEVALDAADGADLVGIWASGPICSGFASSWGQRSFHARHAFHLDFSVHAGGDKAVKAGYAGFDFEPDALRAEVQSATTRLEALRRPPKTIPPGEVRAWLSPAALEEVLGLVAWDSFGLKQQRTRQSALQRIVDGVGRLSPLVHLSEDVAGGVAPRVGAAGFHRPERVPLISAGAHAGSLVSPRAAREFGVPTTGGGSAPDSLLLAAGDLPESEALARLGTGVWVGNLWYTNWSDRPANRLTGMTRFATFWVEGGEIVAPLSVMRFDDTLERMLGSELEALSDRCALLLSSNTYDRRSTSSMRLPGALLRSLSFTL